MTDMLRNKLGKQSHSQWPQKNKTKQNKNPRLNLIKKAKYFYNEEN
jgi:hypothetical protein